MFSNIVKEPLKLPRETVERAENNVDNKVLYFESNDEFLALVSL